MKKTFFCATCKGKCEIVVNPEQAKKARYWRRSHPPKGEGWQVWETVSEGSPITPVFATAEALITHLCTKGTTWDQKAIRDGRQLYLPTRYQAEAFVRSGWVPSAVITNTGTHMGIAVAAAMEEMGS